MKRFTWLAMGIALASPWAAVSQEKLVSESTSPRLEKTAGTSATTRLPQGVRRQDGPQLVKLDSGVTNLERQKENSQVLEKLAPPARTIESPARKEKLRDR